jgi:kynurenine formamidase
MAQRWNNRPEGSNWGDFGPDDQIGRINLLTPERTRRAAEEIREGISFCLGLPLDLPGGMVLNTRRGPPELRPVMRDGEVSFNLSLSDHDPLHTDVTCDDALFLYNQYSSQWDSLAHMGAHFDADGDGEAERVFYNGWQVVDGRGQGTHGPVGARNLGIENMAESGVQGRGVMIDLYAHFGDARHHVGYDDLMTVMAADDVDVEDGDMVCLHTGLGRLIMDADGEPDPALRAACPVLEGRDEKLLQWITDTGLVVLASDNQAVEASTQLGREMTAPGPALPLHEHCLFKLGVHLGEFWYLSELADWLRNTGRYRFFLTAPPLRMPGAVGSPATPVATV